jgi:hypothetical protein
MPKREHRSNAEWQDIIERQEQTGLTGVAFCLQEGIYAKTFYRQRKLLRRKGLVAKPNQFIQVQPTPVKPMPLQPVLVLQYQESRLQMPSGTVNTGTDLFNTRHGQNNQICPGF